MNEKVETKAQSRTSPLQRDEESESRKIIESCEAEEAQLFAQRGYGGYIKSETIQHIRKTKREAASKLDSNDATRKRIDKEASRYQ